MRGREERDAQARGERRRGGRRADGGREETSEVGVRRAPGGVEAAWSYLDPGFEVRTEPGTDRTGHQMALAFNVVMDHSG